MSLYSNTLAVVRQYLSSAVGDLLMFQAGTSGATTTKIYAPALWQADDYYNDHHYDAYVYAGTNIGVEKRATDWDLSAYLLTIHSAYSAACDATSYVELHHIFTQDEYRKAINLAIESVADGQYLIDKTDTTTVQLTSTTDNLDNTVYTYEYTLPTDQYYINKITTERGVSGVKLTGTVDAAFTAGETVTGGTSGATGERSYDDGSTYIRLRKVDGTFVVGEDATGATSTCATITAVDYETAGAGYFDEDDVIDLRSWRLISSRKLKLHEDYYSVDEDLFLRIEGQGRQAVLTADTGICYLPLDWVVQKAITFLPQSKIGSNKLDNVFRQALLFSANEPRNSPHPASRKVIE